MATPRSSTIRRLSASAGSMLLVLAVAGTTAAHTATDETDPTTGGDAATVCSAYVGLGGTKALHWSPDPDKTDKKADKDKKDAEADTKSDKDKKADKTDKKADKTDKKADKDKKAHRHDRKDGKDDQGRKWRRHWHHHGHHHGDGAGHKGDGQRTSS